MAALLFGSTTFSADIPSSAALAFVSIRSGDAHIYIRDGQGVDRMLTDGKTVNTQPAISADGRVAFVSQVNGKPTLFTMREDGSGRRAVTGDARAETAPSWSPDGKFLAFYSMAMNSGVTELRVVDLESGNTAIIAGQGKDMGPAPVSWSADGRRLAFLGHTTAGKNQVFVAERDSGSVREVSSKYAPRGAAFADISPDGRKVAWVADMRGTLPIIVTDIDTGVSVDLTSGTTYNNESPRWSPDGKQLVFASVRSIDISERNEIYIIDADGKNVRNVSNHPMEDFDPKWSADGRSIVFASLRNGTTQLFEVSLASGITRQLSNHASHDMDHAVRSLVAAR